MRGTQLSELHSADPAGVAEALDLVTGFDQALVSGLARLGERQSAALTALAGAVAGTPLGVRVAEAVDKIAAGSVTDEHVTALAGARTALFGAVHDAMLGQLDTALGRTRAMWEGHKPEAGPVNNLLIGARSWLTELALTGWRGVDHDLVSASAQTLHALLAEPSQRRMAVLLDGLAAELRASCPVVTMERVPVRRWADLWSRALLLAAGAQNSSTASTQTNSTEGANDTASVQRVSGRLLILGVDVHEHATAIQVQVHGILEPAGGTSARLVRTSVSAAKVETIVGPALWQLFGAYPVLMGALAGQLSLEVTDLIERDGGDLIWADDRASAADPADPFAVARVQLPGALAPAVPSLERHPVRIAEPVLLEGYKAKTDGDKNAVTFDIDGSEIEVAVDRLPTCGPLTPQMVAASTACLGLIRWDGGRWLVQPLAVSAMVKRKPVTVHTGDWALGPTDPKVVKAMAKSGDAVAVLRERAGRLLRK